MINKQIDKLKAKIEVKLGDNLSPNLFKILINLLPCTFYDYFVPDDIRSTKLNCFVYADDAVLLYTSQTAMIRCLNK